MIDWSLIEGFDWDTGNERKSVDKHGVGRDEAENGFTDPAILISADQAHSGVEQRFNALGRTADGRMLHLTFTLRQGGSYIRIISARDANRKERAIYDTQT